LDGLNAINLWDVKRFGSFAIKGNLDPSKDLLYLAFFDLKTFKDVSNAIKYSITLKS